MKPSDEFKSTLSTTLNAKAGDKQLILFDGLMDKLLEMLMGLFDQCIGSLTPGEVAERVSNPSEATRIRFRTRVRKEVYNGSKEYRAQGGQNVADSVLEATAALGNVKCEALVKEMTEGPNWFPNSDLLMG